MSPLASASATSVPAMAERSSEMPPSASGTPRIGSPISRLALSSASGASQVSLASAAAGRTTSVGELRHHVDQHLLVLGGRQVEDALRLRGRRPDAGLALVARPRERAAGVGHRLEPAAGDREDRLLGRLAELDLVDQVALGEPVEAGDQVADRVALRRARHAVLAARLEAVDEGHAVTVTLSYTRGYTRSRGSGHSSGPAVAGVRSGHAGSARSRSRSDPGRGRAGARSPATAAPRTATPGGRPPPDGSPRRPAG